MGIPTVPKVPLTKRRRVGAEWRYPTRAEAGRRVAPGSQRMNFTERMVSRWSARTSVGKVSPCLVSRASSFSRWLARRASSAS
jgi:hypothetical protein